MSSKVRRKERMRTDDAYRSKYRLKRRLRHKERKATDPSYRYRFNLKRQLRSKYDLSLDDFNLLMEVQNNVCAICGRDPVGVKRLDVDHDHRTQRIRGLLCRDCNLGLGRFRDNPNLLEAAKQYLS